MIDVKVVRSMLTSRNFYACRYGLLFFVGVVFGSMVMFYSSVDISSVTVGTQYLWSEKERAYIAVRGHNKIDAPSVQYVMILTYMRSGSSFTGDVLQRHPHAFYVFEPLISIYHDRYILYLNGTRRNLTMETDLRKEALTQLLAWYTCDLYQLDVKALRYLFLDFGRQTSNYYHCIGREKSLAKIKKCLPDLIRECKNSNVRIIKTIRMTMNSAKPLLENYPNFKIIHLIRDPRGIFNSRIATEPKYFPRSRVRTHTTELCAEMSRDMSVTNAIIKDYSTRLIVLQYENLAEHPYKTTARLYDFLGTTPSLEIYGYVFCITSMGGVAERNYDIKRSNSTSTANKWKKDLRRAEIFIIDSVCKTAYKQLGYSPVANISYHTRINTLQ
ncbi:carbohydrate sulfotransferase 1 isoform X1 [Patella vulgata]|uniref:carbohydrate sulfotransferase 1 isoform X1 n=1 Tax=Patella vulgata TaxID=6465 RepID=UPI0024A82E96|nr:carbohydrate sulfotransferase 1 isoform X1 [Patella vulgata]XP_050407756.2 carbohydrate sulfotransferase 1 isoform X1 [Patella vulgata]XP_050407757.2 carbohydrate sulfotransferase 1 isoform X1 [Patella vulgata]XP_050407758.2 carbohydrate sulfotransferase 1 isoform X1 [Patella vulgata]XP_055957213.1 carbohydrate sulfotransferase 1 isoform X1 [Patella vulgata]